jgi:hypothetical protein
MSGLWIDRLEFDGETKAVDKIAIEADQTRNKSSFMLAGVVSAFFRIYDLLDSIQMFVGVTPSVTSTWFSLIR